MVKKKGPISLRRRYTLIYIPLFFLIFLINTIIITQSSYKHTLLNYKEYRLVIKELIKQNISILQQANYIYDQSLSGDFINKLDFFRDTFSRVENRPDLINLQSIKDKWGESWDLYIIDSTCKIIKTTYKPDENLDFKIISPSFAERLNKIRRDKSIVLDAISIETSGKQYRKFGYTGSSDKSYILEIGMAIPIDNKLYNLINPAYIASSLKSINLKSLPIEQITIHPVNKNMDEKLKIIHDKIAGSGEDYLENINWKTRLVSTYFNTEYNSQYPTETNFLVEITYSLQPVMQRIRNTLILNLFQLVFMELVAFVLLIQISKHLNKPIYNMVSDMRAISNGEWNHPISPVNSSELLSIKEAVEHLVQSLMNEKNTAEKSTRQYTLALKSSRDVIFEWIPSLHFLFFSENISQVLERDPGKRTGRKLEYWIYQQLRPESKKELKNTVKNLLDSETNHLNLEVQLNSFEGPQKWILFRGAMEWEKGSKKIIGILADITLSKERQQQIEELAFNNRISGYPNLQSFLQCEYPDLSSDSFCGIVLINLDDSSRVYTTFGYEWRNKVIREFCKEIEFLINQQKDSRDWDFYHINVDEILLIYRTSDSETRITEKIIALFDKICKGISFKLEQEFYFTASVGALVTAESNLNKKLEVLHKVDLALKRAKSKGKNSLEFYEESLNLQSKAMYKMIQKVWRGIHENSLSLAYQPIVTIGNVNNLSFEALLRLNPDSQISPEEFIKASEASGLIHLLGSWILDQAIRQINIIQKEGHSFGYISVNISPLQFRETNTIKRLMLKCSSSGVDPSKIQLEITESALMQSSDKMIETLKELRSLGFKIALDDFGTGFSSLAYLTSFPVDTIKIDKNLTSKILTDPKNSTVVSSIIRLAGELSLNLIIEGIETEEQREWMLNRNCTIHQGYFYSKPLSSSKMISWLDNFQKTGSGR